MKLLFLGTGSAFTVGHGNYHSNMLLEDGKSKLLIDCGSDVRLSLHTQGMTHRDITDVYVSHLHADHSGGLEWLAFSTKFDPDYKNRPKLHICETLVHRLWNNVLSGGLNSIEGISANLSTYFDVESVPQNSTFEWQGVKLRLMRTEHVKSDHHFAPSYGLIFTINGITCLITTDTQLTPNLFDFYNQADIIFQDCETAPVKSGVHAHYSQLVTLEPDIKSKMWLYHYNPCPLPDAKAAGFRGFVKPGQVFDFDDKNSFEK